MTESLKVLAGSIVCAVAACSSTPEELVLIDCAAAGQLAFNNHQKFVDELNSVGISPSIMINPYLKKRQANITRLLLSGEPEVSEIRDVSYHPTPEVEPRLESEITERMKYLSTMDGEETERINRKCNRVLPNGRARF